ERCHGPGELHVQRQRERRTEPGDWDDTIVNPSRLEPALREAVCEQCHLQGQARVLRRGRGVFDYRPGLPLHLSWTVFEKPPGAATAPPPTCRASRPRTSPTWPPPTTASCATPATSRPAPGPARGARGRRCSTSTPRWCRPGRKRNGSSATSAWR